LTRPARGAPQQGDRPIAIDHNGKTRHGSYKVESGVLSLWMTGRDGVTIGPMSVILRGMPEGAALKTLLQEYVESLRDQP
jgi:hypothetical protein